MIKTSTDLSAVVTQLSEEKTIEFSGVGRNMDASEYNGILYQIENELNSLYENVRLLNDMAEYCRNHVITSVEEKRAKFIEKLKVIEQLTDSYRDKSYVTHMVPFMANQTQVRNREGKIISPMTINSGKLEMSGEITGQAEIKSAILNASDGCTNTSVALLAEGNPCHSEYLMDEPVIGGVKESYEIQFKTPISANYIDIDTTNCDVSNIYGINTSGSSVFADLASSYMRNMEIGGLRFDIVAKDCQNVLLDDNASKTKTLLVRTGEHKANKETRSDDEGRLKSLEKLNRMGVYRGDYASWVKNADAVEKKNAGSGSITMPEYSSDTELRTFDNSAITLPGGAVIEPFSDTGYVYTPSGNVHKEDVMLDGGYETEEMPSYTAEAEEAQKHGFKYAFGIDSIKVQQKSINEECGYQSEPIELGECTYIELSAQEIGDNPVEYSILDGMKEVPILPVEQVKVEKERLLYQQGTRFAVNSNETVTIYQDGTVTSLLLDDTDTFDYAAHEYTVSYTPVDPYRYHPESSSVQVKIVQRKSEQPTTIQTASIRKHGGALYWTTLV